MEHAAEGGRVRREGGREGALAESEGPDWLGDPAVSFEPARTDTQLRPSIEPEAANGDVVPPDENDPPLTYEQPLPDGRFSPNAGSAGAGTNAVAVKPRPDSMTQPTPNVARGLRASVTVLDMPTEVGPTAARAPGPLPLPAGRAKRAAVSSSGSYGGHERSRPATVPTVSGSWCGVAMPQHGAVPESLGWQNHVGPSGADRPCGSRGVGRGQASDLHGSGSDGVFKSTPATRAKMKWQDGKMRPVANGQMAVWHSGRMDTRWQMDTGESVRALQRSHINMTSDEKSLQEYAVGCADADVEWYAEDNTPVVSETHEMGWGLVGAQGGQQKWQMLKLNPLNAFLDPARVTQSAAIQQIHLTTEAVVSVPSAKVGAATVIEAAEEIAKPEQELPSLPNHHDEIRFLDARYFEDDRVSNFRSPHQQTSRDRMRSLEYALQLLREGKNIRDVCSERPALAQPASVRTSAVAPSEKTGGGPVDVRRHGPRGGFGVRTKPLELDHALSSSNRTPKSNFSMFELLDVREDKVTLAHNHGPALTHQYLYSELKSALAPNVDTKAAHAALRSW
jgi:hypothetical protein